MAVNVIDMLLNLCDESSENNIEYEDFNYEEVIPEFNYLSENNNETKNSINVPQKLTQSNKFTFEEQKELEEPIEIDLRNISKSYGINSIDFRQKSKKQPNDIIKNYLGEANMKFVRGRHEEAIEMVFHIIQMNPQNSEPYDFLGCIYYTMGDYQKALEWYLLALEFHPKDSKRWEQLAEMAQLNSINKSALKFYSQAILLSPRNLVYYIKKSNLLEKMNMYSEVYKTLSKILTFLDPTNYKMKLSIVFRISNALNKMNMPDKALKVIEDIMMEHLIEQDSKKFESFFIYLPNYLDLLLANDRPKDVFLKFIQYKLINLKNIDDLRENNKMMENFIENTEDYFNCNDIVLRSKFICALLYLQNCDAKRLMVKFNEIEDASIQELIYPQLIPALMQVSEYELAYLFVSKLIKNYQLSKYWFWSGLCLRKMSRIEEAITAYERAIEYDKNNYDAVNELSDLCNQIGIPERALENVNYDHLTIDIHLLMTRCNLLFICKQWKEFIRNCKLLLSSNICFLNNWDHVNEFLVKSLTIASIAKSVKSLRRRYYKLTKQNQLIGGTLSKENFFTYWKKSIFVLLNYIEDCEEAVRWAFSGLFSTYCDQLIEPMLLIIFRTCIDAKFFSFTFDLSKILVKEYRTSGKMWYAFSIMMTNIYQDFRHKRLCIRLWSELPDNVNIVLMNGHIAFTTSRYIHALGIYLMIYRMKTSYRYDSFHVALTYMHLICQGHILDKCSLFVQMIAFLNNYIEKIGKCQETYFNVARTFHILGFKRYAIELYEQALSTPLKIYDKRFDLSPEIALNLAQICRSCGDYQRANELFAKYCTI